MDLLQNWLLMALLTPTFWAMGCLLDSYMIGGRIYRRPSDGVIVSCLFCLAPVLLAFSLNTTAVTPTFLPGKTPIIAMTAGLAYSIHLIFYFRTLFCLNDVSGAETFISLSVLIVPFLAWLLLSEVLPSHFYLAFSIAASGVLLQCLPVIRRLGKRMLINMVVCVVAVSLSMVLQSHALKTHGFVASTIAFNLTCFLIALALIFSKRGRRRRIYALLQNFPALLFVSEVLGVLAILSSHRATQQGPSVSLVALVECLLPLFIMLFSVVLIGVGRHTRLLNNEYQETLVLQVRGLPSKIGALALLMISFSSLLI